MALQNEFVITDSNGGRVASTTVFNNFRTWIESLPDERKTSAWNVYTEHSNSLEQLVTESKLERTVDDNLIWNVTEIEPSAEFQNLYQEYLTASGLTQTINRSNG
jgi:hypothetical protein